jgi:regulation of enolase protein 1 (concanavalin A-like superfamily)
VTEHVTIPAVPMPLRWLSRPRTWRADESSLAFEAGAGTDWFVDPLAAASPVLNAPALVGKVSGDYVLSARVGVDFGAPFDAGVLMLYAAEYVWAKLCFEYSPQHEPMVVSVVTRGVSDDASGFVVEGSEAWLRVARIGSAFAFHASTDARSWRLVRYFALGEGGEPAVGFEAQSPTGDGCVVRFEEIRFDGRRLDDLRGGA